MKRSFIKIIVFILILVVLGGATATLFTAYKIYSPVDRDDHVTIDFVIKEGEGVNQVSARLEERHLVADNFYFDIYLWLIRAEGDLQAGVYALSRDMRTSMIADILTGGDIELEGRLTFIEGLTLEEVADEFSLYKSNYSVAAVSGDMVYEKYRTDFIDLAADPANFDYPFLGSLPAEATLEGYLFPDTYRVYHDITGEELIDKMLDNLNNKITEDLRRDIAAQGKTLFEVLIMASIVQQEVLDIDEMKMVAGVYYNRLEQEINLQSDATITYITGKEDPRPSDADTLVDSPYNTYLHPGLPPGPINNPGLDAITAVVYPAEHNYLYFLTMLDTGEAAFSVTAEEHQEAREKYFKD